MKCAAHSRESESVRERETRAPKLKRKKGFVHGYRNNESENDDVYTLLHTEVSYVWSTTKTHAP